MVRQEDKAKIRNVKVITSEECVPKHKLLVMDMWFKATKSDVGLPRSAGTRKVEPIWILLKQETVSGSGISWAICKSAPRPEK